MPPHFNGLTPAEAERLAMLADEMRRQADAFVELDTLRHDIARHACDGATA